MPEPDLARLEHENMIDAMSLAGSVAPGAFVRREGGVALILTGLPILLFNQVIVELEGTSEAALADAVATARARGAGFVVNLRVGGDDRWLGLMQRLGLVALSPRPWMPGMAMYPIPTGDAPAPAGHEIRPATDPAALEDHIATAAAGFEMPEDLLRSVVGQAAAARPGVTFYVGYSDGLPVSTGLGIRTGRTIGVYNVSTIPSHRRRGLGAAMTARIADDGVAAGCDVAILQASDMGYPVYERMGYRTVVEYMGYVEPD
jgi:GNAT superfamily N-acetyltransferase